MTMGRTLCCQVLLLYMPEVILNVGQWVKVLGMRGGEQFGSAPNKRQQFLQLAYQGIGVKSFVVCLYTLHQKWF
jgi:hypothetical protein